MTFRKEKGRYEGVLPNGDIVTFENGAEMVAVAELREKILLVMGRGKENSKFGIRNSESKRPAEVPKKKKVRIRIDTDVEYIGNSEFEIWNSKLMMQNEKALA